MAAEASQHHRTESPTNLQNKDKLLLSPYNRPFPFMLIPSAISYRLGYLHRQEQDEILEEIRALNRRIETKVERFVEASE